MSNRNFFMALKSRLMLHLARPLMLVRVPSLTAVCATHGLNQEDFASLYSAAIGSRAKIAAELNTVALSASSIEAPAKLSAPGIEVVVCPNLRYLRPSDPKLTIQKQADGTINVELETKEALQKAGFKIRLGLVDWDSLMDCQELGYEREVATCKYLYAVYHTSKKSQMTYHLSTSCDTIWR
jgi:hypothetical protein